MGVKWSTKKNRFPEMKQAAVDLDGRRVNVGVYGEQAWLAGIHEYGCDIKVTRAKYLTVPCSPKSKGKRAGDFPDLFFLQAKSGEKFLARPKGKTGLEILFWLTPKVHIPERAFLRNGYDENIDGVADNIGALIDSVMDGKISVKEVMDSVGLALSAGIKNAASDLADPDNHWTTKAAKQSSNPLVDTGDMIGAITYKVE